MISIGLGIGKGLTEGNMPQRQTFSNRFENVVKDNKRNLHQSDQSLRFEMPHPSVSIDRVSGAYVAQAC